MVLARDRSRKIVQNKHDAGVRGYVPELGNAHNLLEKLKLSLPKVNTSNHKITKIVRALWSRAERSVCMRVCKHGCDVRCFAFRALITQARIWKSFRVQNSTSLLYLPIPLSAETWKIFTNKLCQFCFRLSWHFKREKSVFWKASFCKTRTDYACKTSCTRLCDW